MRASTGEGWALVTGASRGIGLAMSHVLARHGHDLVVTARSEVELMALAGSLERDHGVSVRVIPADLSEVGASSRLFAALEDREIQIDLLVNNAGFGSRGAFHEVSLDQQIEMLRVNVVSLTELTGLVLPGMLERERGRILQVASTAGFQAGPFMAVYYASKAYVLHYSEALAEELQGRGVTVTALCPGPVPTGFQARAGMEKEPLLKRLLPKMTAEQVAEAGYRAMMSGRRRIVPGVLNKLGTLGVRLTPRTLAAKAARRVNAEGRAG